MSMSRLESWLFDLVQGITGMKADMSGAREGPMMSADTAAAPTAAPNGDASPPDTVQDADLSR